MKRWFLPFVPLTLLALLGCTSKPTNDVSISDPNHPPGVERATPEDKAAVAHDNNQFALELFGQLDKKANLFFSPASISTALAMVYGGARGKTSEQMANVLHFQLDAKRLHPAFSALLFEMKSQGGPTASRLNIANAVWAHRVTRFLPDFMDLIKDNYGAGVQQVDFSKDEEARRTINAWVAEQTADKITDLLKSGDVSPQTRLVLTNAVYFKGFWLHAFKSRDTKEQPFHLTPTKDVPVPMMQQTGEFRFFADEGKGVKLLEMPYRGSQISMVVLLPTRADGLEQLEKQLDVASLENWLKQLGQARSVAVALPKFRMSQRMELVDQLQKMGMTALFRPGEADLSDMTGDQSLFVGKLVHEALVEVNEEGTEAAAATGVAVRAAAEPQRDVFRADHPFLFLIRDTRSRSILFLGRVSNPKNRVG
jgi:serpin B